ncbi:MAG: hypothetical protein J6C55_01430 [Oscillospiraceae bacterium]|nr:hypothetical protein [Oscillospiraceae bacterium]
MKSLFKSFFITFIITMTSGILLLVFMDPNSFSGLDNLEKDIQVQTNLEKKIKRPATEDDILNILQVINLKDKKIIFGILLDPVKNNIRIDVLSNLQKTSFGKKSLSELYDYGGVKLLVKTLNKDYNKNFNKYLVIKNEDNLIDLLDIVGSLEIKDELFDFLKKYMNIKNQIIDPECFVELINYSDNNIIKELFKEVIKQKIILFDFPMGEDIFKKIINKVESDISYKDFYNLTEVDLSKLN